jgi:hypothetical protein
MKNDSTKQTIDVDIAKKITEEEKKSIKKAIIDDPDIRQKRTFLPPKDPVYHLTINQPATVYKGPRPIVN